jgi:hypothetical protein
MVEEDIHKGERLMESCIEKKIYFHDTDCGGVVYYANYLKHLEEARTEYLSGKGIGLKVPGCHKNLYRYREGRFLDSAFFSEGFQGG